MDEKREKLNTLFPHPTVTFSHFKINMQISSKVILISSGRFHCCCCFGTLGEFVETAHRCITGFFYFIQFCFSQQILHTATLIHTHTHRADAQRHIGNKAARQLHLKRSLS